MKKTFYIFLLLFSALIISCSEKDNNPTNEGEELPTTPTTPTVPDEGNKDEEINKDEFIKLAEVSEEAVARAALFSKTLTANGTKPASVYIYSGLTVAKYEGEAGAKKLAARIILMGYTDVLLAIHPEGGEDFAEIRNKDWTRTFNKLLRSCNINVHALMFSEASQYNDANKGEIFSHASVIQQFNKTVAAEERFAGASADWEPHSLTVGSELSDEAGLASGDRWANDRYTQNGANDRLLKRTADILALAKTYLDNLSDQYNLPKLPLNEAINYHVQEQHDGGNLLYGDVTTYLIAGKCADVNVMAYNKRKEEIWHRAQFILAAADKAEKNNSVYICIKTRLGDDEGPGTSLRPEGWDYLIETLTYLHAQAEQYKSLKGIGVYEYSDTEYMWLN